MNKAYHLEWASTEPPGICYAKIMDAMLQHLRFAQLKMLEQKEARPKYLPLFWNPGVFAIGYPYLPSVLFSSILGKETVWKHEEQTLDDLHVRKTDSADEHRIIQGDKYLDKDLELSLSAEAFFSQKGKCQAPEPLTKRVDKLPFLIGPPNPFLDFVDMKLFNSMDQAVCGMTVSIELLRRDRQKISPATLLIEEWDDLFRNNEKTFKRSERLLSFLDPEEDPKNEHLDLKGKRFSIRRPATHMLAIVNYSTNGNSLRLQLKE